MSTITTINSTNKVGDSRATINTNFSNLNTDKLESVNDSNWSWTDLSVANWWTGASTASWARNNLWLVIGTNVQAHSAVLDATTASFTTTDEAKLDWIEANADVTDTANVTSAGATMQTMTLTSTISGGIVTVADQDYTIILKAPHAMTITETTTKSWAGTCTATFKINTTALWGTANSVSTTETSQTHSSANSVIAGDDIIMTVSSNSSCTDMSFTVKYTATLSAMIS